MPGLIEHAYAAKVVANGTRIIDISEVHDSVSEDSLNSIQVSLSPDCDHVARGHFDVRVSLTLPLNERNPHADLASTWIY